MAAKLGSRCSTEGRTTSRSVCPAMHNGEGQESSLGRGPMKPRYLRAGFRRCATIRGEAGHRRMMRCRKHEWSRWRRRHWAMTSIVDGGPDGIRMGRGMAREVVVEIGLRMQRVVVDGERRLEQGACV